MVRGGTVIRGDFAGDREGTLKTFFPRGCLKLLVRSFCFICISIIFGSKSTRKVKLRGASVKVELRGWGRREGVFYSFIIKRNFEEKTSQTKDGEDKSEM